MSNPKPERKSQPGARRLGRQWAGRFALLFMAPLVVFGLIELFAWSIGIQPATNSETHENRSVIDDCRWHPDHLETYCAQEIRAPDGTRHVYVLGASSVLGHPWGEQRNIPHFIGERLDTLYPGEYDVISLAAACKDSLYVRRCAEKVLDTQPDTIVVYTGHNDFSGFMSRWPRLLMWMERSGWWVIELQRALAHTRTWTLINPGAVEPLEFSHDPAATLDPPEVARANERILEGYEENLQGILDRARSHKTNVIWITPVSNLFEYPIQKKAWNLVDYQNDRAGKDAKAWALDYARGITAFREERFDDALAAFALAREQISRTRAPALLNERLRELDATLEDLHLVDFETQLEEIGREEGIGCNFFGTDEYCDGVHPNPRTSRLIGESVAGRIAELREDRP